MAKPLPFLHFPTRRGILPLLLALAVLWAGVVPARAQSALPYGGLLSFSVFRGSSPIGEHRFAFEQVGDQMHVRINVELQVKLGFVTVFRYVHENHEVWEDGKLIAITTKTNDDGKPFEVRARRIGNVFEIQTLAGRSTLPADILPSSYWHPDTPNHKRFLDTQRGILLNLDFAPGGTETVTISDGQRIPARRYDVTGDLNVTAWYAQNGGAWGKLSFPARGSEIEYVMAAGTPTVP